MIWEQRVGTAAVMFLTAIGLVVGTVLFLSRLFVGEPWPAMLGLAYCALNIVLMHNADAIGQRHIC